MNDLSKAAERLRRIEAGEDIVAVYETTERPKCMIGQWGKYEAREAATAQMQGDRENLADAYLAEHPADSEVAIDKAWLKSVGFQAGRDHKCDAPGIFHEVWQARMERDGWWFTIDEEGEAVFCGEMVPKPIKTRGDLLRLMAALGIAGH